MFVRYVRLAVALTGVLTLVDAGLVAQSSPSHGLILAETAELVPSGKGRLAAAHGQLPEISAAGYSQAFARSEWVPAMAGSAAFGDVDGDGEAELYLAGSAGASMLLRSAGHGKFREIAGAAKLGGPGHSLSAAFGDYDRSGRPSLFVVGAGGVKLYHNNGDRTFSEVAQKAGLKSPPGELCTSAALDDFDGDGFLDLLVTVYTDLSRPPSKPSLTFPNDFPGAASRLYRNNGNGTFSDVTASAGLAHNPGRARKGIFADFNTDRLPDILILRDDKPPVLYLNRGGKFEDTTWDAGEALTRHAFFDAAVVDLNRDGKPDLVVWSTQSFRALINRGNGTFQREESLPVVTPLLTPFGFHGTVADLDQNGFDDILAVDDERRVRAFANQEGTFREVSLQLPSGFEGAYFVPAGLKGKAGAQLLAFQPNGRIALVGVRTLPAGR